MRGLPVEPVAMPDMGLRAYAVTGAELPARAGIDSGFLVCGAGSGLPARGVGLGFLVHAVVGLGFLVQVGVLEWVGICPD